MALSFAAKDPEFEAKVRESFGRQALMATLGASLARIAPGAVDLALPYSSALTQQHGFLHAGVLAAVLDSACGYAAFTLMPAGTGVLSIEFKLNLLAPAAGERFEARARVLRPGRNITVCAADAFAFSGADQKLVATMIGTMMCVRDREDVSG